MEQVTRAVREYVGEVKGEIPPGDFLAAAKAWACFSLSNFVGERLTRALEVSRALAEYQALDVPKEPQ